MTEGQLRYQTLLENQRHNLAVESYSKDQAQAALKKATIEEEQWQVEKPYAEKKAFYEADEPVSKIWKNSATGWADMLKGIASFGKLLF